MIIILEGVDGAGKSTLAKQMSEEYNMPIHHFSYPKTEEEKANMFQMYADAIHEYGNGIFDRCWYSEMVYGPMLREKSCISWEQMIELEKLLASNGGGLLVHCTAPFETIWNRFETRGDDYIKQDRATLQQLHARYDRLMIPFEHKIPVVRYLSV